MGSADTVTLEFPREARYLSVARLVVGGMAAPLDMSYDALDDLQLAISSLLDNDTLTSNGDITLRLDLGDGWLRASIGEFETKSLDGALLDSNSEGEGESKNLDLRRLLETIVDEVSVDGNGAWVTLTKHVKAPV
jgi:anti-sigma regulatory factor (Ser/Thr protein kinase)